MWAFGVLLWQMVTGEAPWGGNRQMQIMMGVMEVRGRAVRHGPCGSNGEAYRAGYNWRCQLPIGA